MSPHFEGVPFTTPFRTPMYFRTFKGAPCHSIFKDRVPRRPHVLRVGEQPSPKPFKNDMPCVIVIWFRFRDPYSGKIIRI